MINFTLISISIFFSLITIFITVYIYNLKKTKWNSLILKERNNLELIKQELNHTKLNLKNIENSNHYHQEQIHKLSEENKTQYEEIHEKDKQISELKKDLTNEKNLTKEKILLLEDAKDKLIIQFQDISNKILEEKSLKFTEQNKNNLNSILEPIKTKMDNFSSLIKETHSKENEDRIYLKKELEDLKNLNHKLSDSANFLTNALTKQNKTQGDWGEMILETILEQSGLKKDVQYYFQKTLKDENNKLFRPDIIIKLPENKNIIIDSKVSLIHFKDYSNATDKNLAKDYLNKHISSVEAHIKDLAKKDYSELLSDGQNLDVVLMFIPIESAYLSFINEKNNLINEYFSKKNIIPVGPSNLILTLKIIYNIWRYEYQNQNTYKIAEAGGKLYDKLVNFTESLSSIGNYLNKAQESHKNAFNQLKEGRGNLFKQAEELKNLGIKTKKQFDKTLINDLTTENDEDNNILNISTNNN